MIGPYMSRSECLFRRLPGRGFTFGNLRNNDELRKNDYSALKTRANHSLERAQPQRDFKHDVAMLRRSARGRWAATPAADGQ